MEAVAGGKGGEGGNGASSLEEFERARARGEPWKFAGVTEQRGFPVEKYARYGRSVKDDGGRVTTVRRASSTRDEAGVARTYPGGMEDGGSMSLLGVLEMAGAAEGADVYACQVELDSKQGPLQEAMLAGAKSCLPAWIPETATVQAWLCASDAPSLTECHMDGLDNVMCVLEGRKVVELWAPGTLTPLDVWESRVDPGTRKPDWTLSLDPGDAGYWPEGWWHRVESAPRTRAVNAWFPGARPSLVGLPDSALPFAFRALAHRLVERQLKAALHHGSDQNDHDIYRAAYVLLENNDPATCTTEQRSRAAAYPRRLLRAAVLDILGLSGLPE